MSVTELVDKIKSNLDIPDTTKDLIINDMILLVLGYCNLIEVPIELEPFIRIKVQSIINYEAENGTSTVFDVKAIKEGDVSITYNVDDKTSKETIYGLSDKDKKSLQQFRRTRK